MSERYTVTIREIPASERPRERLYHHGSAALSSAELLAIQLRIGTKERSALGLAELLLSEFGGLRGVANATIDELRRVKGVGEAKAIEIAASVEIGRRLAVLSDEAKTTIRSPQDVSNLLMAEMRDLKKEHLKSLLLDTKNGVMKIHTVSIGILGQQSRPSPRSLQRCDCRQCRVAHRGTQPPQWRSNAQQRGQAYYGAACGMRSAPRHRTARSCHYWRQPLYFSQRARCPLRLPAYVCDFLRFLAISFLMCFLMC